MWGTWKPTWRNIEENIDIFVANPRHTWFIENNTKNNDIMHLFPQFWWERHKWHCGWREGPGNRRRSSCLGKYPHQSPKTHKQAFASGWCWVGITEVFLCCVNLSLTQKELWVRARSTYWGKSLLQSPKTEERVFASVPRSAGLEELRQACVNLSTNQKELKCERGKDRASHVAVENRALTCK